MKKMIKWMAIPVFFAALLVLPLHADQNSPELDRLFDSLHDTTTSPHQAQQLTAAIWNQWLQTDNQKAQQLMMAGIERMNQSAFGEALEVFDALVELAPDYAEAWNKRATVYYILGEYEKSTQDVERTLDLEPRHFGALSGQGLIYIRIDRKEAALKWFKKALKANPFMDSVRFNVEMLETELKGKII